MKKRLLPSSKPAALWLFLTATISAGAALTPTEWRYRQELPVPAPGLVQVHLPDRTFDAAQPNLTDLRLLDPQGQETALLVDHPPVRVAHSIRPAAFETRLIDGNTVITLDTGTSEAIQSVAIETPHPHFMRSVRLEAADADGPWRLLDQGVPLFRQWGAEKLSLNIGNQTAAKIRITISGTPLPFTAASLDLSTGPTPVYQPVGVHVSERQEFSGESVLTLTLDGRHAPLAELELVTPETVFMRRVTVTVRDVRDLVASERVVGSGTLYRVALDGAPAKAQLALRFEHMPLSRELLVHIHNGDSPPLAVTEVRLRRQPVSVLFMAPVAGRYTLLTGNPQATAPRYDLAAFAGDLRSAHSTLLVAGTREDMPGYQPRASLAEPPLPEVPLVGAPLDLQEWTRRKPVLIASPGVQELELDPAVLAATRSDLGDLRLTRAGLQIPFLLERTGLARAITLALEPQPDPKQPAASIWQIKLPQTGLPLLRIALTTETDLFQREFRLYERVPAANGPSYYRHTLARGTWSRTPEPGSLRTRMFELTERPQTDTLFLETDNGDNAPIALTSFRAEHAVVRLVFKVAETDGYELVYGRATATAPRYDLSLVAMKLLTSGRNIARMGVEEVAPEGLTRGVLRRLQGGPLFWGALGLVVIALLAVVARLLPKPATTK
jgi:hypothetical protein